VRGYPGVKMIKAVQPRSGCVVEPRVAVRGYPGVKMIKAVQPRRGCVVEPRVGRPRLPWGQDDQSRPTPKGLRRRAQGCRPRLPWGQDDQSRPTPKGLRRPAQGCRPRLPWVKLVKSLEPRRGCVVQPRVAVRGYPGSSWSNLWNPEGVASSSPGLPSAATLGQVGQISATLKGWRPETWFDRPFRNSVGLGTQHSALSTQHSALSTQHSALSTQHSTSS